MKGDIRLTKLKLHNFKGIKDFTLETGGNDVSVFGDNGTGKTTLADAWFWLLFNKDSQNRAEFGIKTLSEDGKPIPGLDHEVEAVLVLNGKPLVLKKVYAETWTKKRGSAKEQFTGHTTSHFIDGVPVKKNDYDAQIGGIIDEDAFKLLTNPRHFNEVLHWEKRRELLLEVCGDVSDEDVIASDSKLAELPGILNGHNLEDYRKIIQARRTEINKELERVPVRIDEAMRNLPEGKVSGEIVATSLAALKDQRKSHAEKLANLEAGGGVAEETKKLREIEAEMLEVEKAHFVVRGDKIQVGKNDLRGLQDEAGILESAIKTEAVQLQSYKDSASLGVDSTERLRREWTKESATSFIYDEESDTCPTCGQSLPIEMVQIARDKALADFNARKAQRLEDISNQGKIAKATNDKLSEQIATAQKQLAKTEVKLTEVKTKRAEAETTVAQLEAQRKDFTEDEAYIQLQGQKAKAEATITQLKETLEPEIAKQRQAITDIDQEISDCERSLAQIEQRASGLKRIEELKAQERLLASEYEKLEGEIFLMEAFIKTKVKLLESHVNGMFGITKWKMFETQVNGGISEICEATVDGVSYNSGLNNGMRIAVGMDCINVLQKHYEFMAPLWIDNAEAFCHLPKMSCQVIKLFVSEIDKVLRIESAQDYVEAGL